MQEYEHQWFLFDDDSVERIDDSQLHTCFGSSQVLTLSIFRWIDSLIYLSIYLSFFLSFYISIFITLNPKPYTLTRRAAGTTQATFFSIRKSRQTAFPSRPPKPRGEPRTAQPATRCGLRKLVPPRQRLSRDSIR